MKDKKRPPSEIEVSRLELVREVFRTCGREKTVCVVIPDGVTIRSVFGIFYDAVVRRLSQSGVLGVPVGDLTENHIDDFECVLDLSSIPIPA